MNKGILLKPARAIISWHVRSLTERPATLTLIYLLFVVGSAIAVVAGVETLNRRTHLAGEVRTGELSSTKSRGPALDFSNVTHSGTVTGSIFLLQPEDWLEDSRVAQDVLTEISDPSAIGSVVHLFSPEKGWHTTTTEGQLISELYAEGDDLVALSLGQVGAIELRLGRADPYGEWSWTNLDIQSQLGPEPTVWLDNYIYFMIAGEESSLFVLQHRDAGRLEFGSIDQPLTLIYVFDSNGVRLEAVDPPQFEHLAIVDESYVEGFEFLGYRHDSANPAYGDVEVVVLHSETGESWDIHPDDSLDDDPDERSVGLDFGAAPGGRPFVQQNDVERPLYLEGAGEADLTVATFKGASLSESRMMFWGNMPAGDERTDRIASFLYVSDENSATSFNLLTTDDPIDGLLATDDYLLLAPISSHKPRPGEPPAFSDWLLVGL